MKSVTTVGSLELELILDALDELEKKNAALMAQLETLSNASVQTVNHLRGVTKSNLNSFAPTGA